MPKDDPGSPKAEKRRKLYGAALFAAITLFNAHAASLLTSLAHEEIDSRAWAAAYIQILIDLHAHAAFAGRGVGVTLTGAPAPVMGFADDAYATAVVAGQAPHVADFRRDIEEGRYNDPETEELDPARCLSRVDLYANRAHGTAHEACVGSLGIEDKIYWRLGDDDNCESCITWSEGGPYSRFSLPAVPGDGKSQCKTNCLCHLEINKIPIPMLARPNAYLA